MEKALRYDLRVTTALSIVVLNCNLFELLLNTDDIEALGQFVTLAHNRQSETHRKGIDTNYTQIAKI